MRVTLSWPRFTIERLRTLVLIGGGVLVAAIVIFLVGGQWTRRLLTKDIPGRLGINIESQADGVNYTQTRKGKTIFKIHAARAVTMKSGGKTLLHDVKIDLYGDDGNRADTISGSEFEYDPAAGVATAAGAVEIAMMRPGIRPAVAQLMPGSSQNPVHDPAKSEADNSSEITDNEIHVKTSGLTFDQKAEVATTNERVDFALRQGNGTSIGATYDSKNGHLVLDRAVELLVLRDSPQGAQGSASRGPVTVHASHAEFQHGAMVCQLTQAKAEYTGGTAQSANALIHFRDDGSVIRMDGSGGVDLQTATGGHVTAPIGALEFDEHNHPSHGLLQGGVRLDMTQPNRQIDGTSPTAQLTFDSLGQLKLAHMEQGVLFHSRQQTTMASGAAAQIHRSWSSQTADVAFAPAAAAQNSGSKQIASQGQSHVEPRTIHGFGGVVVTSETTSEGVITPSRLSADTVVAELAPGGALTSLSGTGHASFDERTSAGVHQASSSDQLEVRFSPEAPTAEKSTTPGSARAGEDSKIASVVEIGHVVLVQDQPPGKNGQAAGRNGNASEVQAGIRATADRADYDGESQMLHLTGSPRVRDGALDLTAVRVDFARATGDAFAHGDVRASWNGNGGQPGSAAGSKNLSLPGASLLAGVQPGSGGNGPVHAVAAEAELHQVTQEVVFRGGSSGNGQGIEARLWQSVNSVIAPVIVLNRQKETLTAEAAGAANPVKTVLVSNPPSAGTGKPAGAGKKDSPSVIRVRSGDLHYSEGERIALFHSGAVGSVTAETTGTGGTSTVVSHEAEVRLLPEKTHSAAGAAGNATIDQLIARDHVVVDWPGRRGTGEKLVYLSEDGTFTLTGTSGAPPRITDQERGTVTGSALVYHSRDGSVTVAGDGGKTVTETHSRK